MTLAYTKGIDIDYLDLRSISILKLLHKERILEYRKEELKALSNLSKDNSEAMETVLDNLYTCFFPWAEDLKEKKQLNARDALVREWEQLQSRSG